MTASYEPSRRPSETKTTRTKAAPTGRTTKARRGTGGTRPTRRTALTTYSSSASEVGGLDRSREAIASLSSRLSEVWRFAPRPFGTSARRRTRSGPAGRQTSVRSHLRKPSPTREPLIGSATVQLPAYSARRSLAGTCGARRSRSGEQSDRRRRRRLRLVVTRPTRRLLVRFEATARWSPLRPAFWSREGCEWAVSRWCHLERFPNGLRCLRRSARPTW